MQSTATLHYEEDVTMSYPRLLQLLAILGMLASLSRTGSAQLGPPCDTPTLSIVDGGLYSVTLKVQAGPSGAPGGFAIQWMKLADFVAAGGWPAAAADARLGDGTFVGTPTLNGWGATRFKLGPGEIAYVEPGDLFDETGVGLNSTAAAALQPGTEYVARVRALPGKDRAGSGFAPTIQVRTLNAECTQGYWKNHPESWPSGCLPMTLGTVSYTKSQLLQIFSTPARGNGLISLAHQLITIQLNLCNGSNPAPVSAAVSSANALLGGLVVPPIGSGSLAPSLCSSLTQTLDDYNNGRTSGVVSCVTPVKSSTWGALKAIYR
jgi:hypothetical protein